MDEHVSRISLLGGKVGMNIETVFWPPNLLSLSRILALPFIVSFLLRGNNAGAFTLTALAALTDAFDGYLARRLHRASNLGLIIDPVADKILYDGILVCLAYLRIFPAWATSIIVGRDVLVLSGVLLLIQTRQTIISPVLLGKCTSCALAGTVLVYIAGAVRLGQAAMWMTLAFVLTSGVHYLFRFWRLLRRGTSRQPCNATRVSTDRSREPKERGVR